MSCSFDIGCRTCDVDSGIFDVNWGDAELQELCRKQEVIAAVGDLPWVGGREVGYVPALSAFFRIHAGHDVLPRDEYRRWLDQCREYFKCKACGHMEACVLPKDHAGEHSRVAPPSP